jgi:hypothetical protein
MLMTISTLQELSYGDARIFRLSVQDASHDRATSGSTPYGLRKSCTSERGLEHRAASIRGEGRYGQYRQAFVRAGSLPAPFNQLSGESVLTAKNANVMRCPRQVCQHDRLIV